MSKMAEMAETSEIQYLTIPHIETLNARAEDNGYVTLSPEIMESLLRVKQYDVVIPVITAADVSDAQKVMCLALDFIGNVAMLGISPGDYNVLPTKKVALGL